MYKIICTHIAFITTVTCIYIKYRTICSMRHAPYGENIMETLSMLHPCSHANSVKRKYSHTFWFSNIKIPNKSFVIRITRPTVVIIMMPQWLAALSQKEIVSLRCHYLVQVIQFCTSFANKSHDKEKDYKKRSTSICGFTFTRCIDTNKTGSNIIPTFICL